MIEAGFSKVDITVYEHDMVMLGWGQPQNRSRGVHTPLSARALVLRRGEEAVVMLTAELAFISIALRLAVLERLSLPGVGPHNLLLTATHTHSGPSGYSHFLAYNAPSFGFSPLVLSTLADRLADAVKQADLVRAPARLSLGRATIPTSEPVAFQRSVAAYNRNPDVTPVSARHPERATHREVLTLRVDRAAGGPLGLVSWFGVHGTSLHADNQQLHPDNKGVAAARAEAELGSGAVALFMQEAAGDVSPNPRWDPVRELRAGLGRDDLDSAQVNGEIQARYALRAHAAAGRAPAIEGPMWASVQHVDLSAADAGAARTRPPVLGLPMAAGTAEGPGPLHRVAPGLRLLSRVRRASGAKDNLLPWISVGEGAEGRFLGAIPMRLGFEVVAPVEPMIAFVRAADKAGWVQRHGWVPRVLPLQVLRLGPLIIGAIPTEATTVAGRRLRRALREALAHQGVEQAVLAPYANGYAGYLATEQEYAAQSYEGAATYFGPHSLAAHEAALVQLARRPPPAFHAPVLGPPLERLAEAFLIAQRLAGRTGVRGPGTGPEVPR